MNLKLNIIDLHQLPHIFESNLQDINQQLITFWNFLFVNLYQRPDERKYLSSSEQYGKLFAKPKLDIIDKRIQEI